MRNRQEWTWGEKNCIRRNGCSILWNGSDELVCREFRFNLSSFPSPRNRHESSKSQFPEEPIPMASSSPAVRAVRSQPQSQSRRSHRWPLQVPLRYQATVDNRIREIVSQTVNVSESGLFMLTHMKLEIGAALSLAIHIPKEISGSADCFIKSAGTVIHECRIADGVRGYGVRFDRQFPDFAS
jgi:hypothetical protein